MDKESVVTLDMATAVVGAEENTLSYQAEQTGWREQKRNSNLISTENFFLSYTKPKLFYLLVTSHPGCLKPNLLDAIKPLQFLMSVLLSTHIAARNVKLSWFLSWGFTATAGQNGWDETCTMSWLSSVTHHIYYLGSIMY